MKLKVILSAFIAVLFFTISCEKEAVESIPEIDDDVLALVEEEVLADINFAELLDEGDDGLFWGDAGFSMLKSAEEDNTCKTRTVTKTDNKRIDSLFFDGCEKSGLIVIEYHKNGNNKSNGEKTITYVDFTNGNSVIFNGVKSIKRGNGNYNIKAEMEISKDDGVVINRNYERQVHWICGLDTRGKDGRNDNVKKITGKSEITKIVDGIETKSYSRIISKPLLIVKVCNLKIQAGSVEINKTDGTKVVIDYGKMPEEIDCGTVWTDCNSSVELTKGDETFTVTFDENGKRKKKDDKE